MIAPVAGDHQRAADQMHGAGPAPRHQPVDVVRDPFDARARSPAAGRCPWSRLSASASSTVTPQRTGQDQVEVVTAARQVAQRGQLAAGVHPDAGRATTDVDDRAVAHAEQGLRRADLVDQRAAVEAGRFQHVAGRPGSRSRRHRGRVGRRRVVDGHAQRGLGAGLQLRAPRRRRAEVDHHAVPDGLRPDLVAVHRLVGGVDHRQHDGRGAEVDTDPQRPLGVGERCAQPRRGGVVQEALRGGRRHRSGGAHQHLDRPMVGEYSPRHGRASKASRLMLIRCSGLTLSEVSEPLQVPVPSMNDGSDVGAVSPCRRTGWAC